MLILSVLSSFTGWGFFILISISLYPQFYTNYQLGHVKGFSPDFTFLSLSGFTFYFLHCTWGYFDPTKISGSVNIQDFCYSAHSFVLIVLLVAQCLYYDKQFFKNLQTWVKVYLSAAWTVSLTFCLLEVLGCLPVKGLNLNGCLLFGYLKVSGAFIKYFPQAMKNYTRKSTAGWNIMTTLIELFAWVLSNIQIVLEIFNTGEYESLNVPKICLGFVTILFDLVFVIQHYTLYKCYPEVMKPLIPKHKANLKSENDISVQM